MTEQIDYPGHAGVKRDDRADRLADRLVRQSSQVAGVSEDTRC